MNPNPHYVAQPTLSHAWAECFLRLRSAPRRRLAPLFVTFGGFETGAPAETGSLRAVLDSALEKYDKDTCGTVANTIFPQVLWELAGGDRHVFFQSYLDSLPDYKALAPSVNGQGLYFERLISFCPGPEAGSPSAAGSVGENQLEFIIQMCRKGSRASALQASIFDPRRDHSKAPRQGFPCLQHLTVVPDWTGGTVSLNAFYATQQLFAKAYGNFLGLSRLGIFLAAETGVRLERVTCFIGIEKMEVKPLERDLQPIEEACIAVLAQSGSPSNWSPA